MTLYTDEDERNDNSGRAFRPTPAGDLGALQPQGASVSTEKTDGPAAYADPDFPPMTDAPELERRAYNQMPKAGWRELRLVRFDGSDLYQWRGKKGVHSVFDDAATEVFRINRRSAPVPASQVGMEAEGRNAPKAPSDNPAGEVERLRAALTEIAAEASPYDDSGEPLSVRIAKDLTRRIEIATAALEASQ